MSKKNDLSFISKYIIIFGTINVVMLGVIALSRLIMQIGHVEINALLNYIEVYAIPGVKTLLAIILFFVFRKKLTDEITDAVRNVFYLWSIITIFGQLFYYTVNIYYYRMLMMFLMQEQGDIYTIFYNSTHGFKYMAMFICIMFGIAMTGVILKNKILPIATFLLSAMYLVGFGEMQMVRLWLGDKFPVGIVISAVMFHFIETIGLIGLGIYLEYWDKKYVNCIKTV